MRWPDTRIDRGILLVVLVACLGVLAAVAVQALADQSASGLRAQASARATKAGARGSRGSRGRRGYRGLKGVAGPTGPPATLYQSISINWEGSFANASGRDSQSFVAPGIGYGMVTCSQNTQWVWFKPYDQNDDVAMWTSKFQGNDATVRTARHTVFTGESFYEGMNRYAGETESEGSFVGIIEGRGKLGGSDGSGAAPTTFRLSWYWNFDPSNPRCFVAGTFISNGG